MKLKRGLVGILTCSLIGVSLPYSFLLKNYAIIADAATSLSASDEFITSAGITEGHIYDGSVETDFFEMNGRTYYNGVLFDTTYVNSDRTSHVDFNVENIDKFSCTFGHIDNGRTGYAEVSVYLDDVLVDKFDMTSTMPLKDYSIDTSDSAVLLFTVLRKSGSAYAMANVTIDGIKPEKNYVIPEYSTSESFVDDSFNRYELSMRDAVSEFDAFEMNGRTYYNGVLFDTTYVNSDITSRIDFNVENVDEISFDIAHLDGGREGNATVSVYLDDVLAEEIELTPSMATKRYVLDVSTAKNVRFSVLRISGAAYAFADFDFVPATAGVLGDANGDGLVTIEDAVMLQKWLIAESKELTCWKNVDLCKDSRIDVFDLCLLRRMLIEK